MSHVPDTNSAEADPHDDVRSRLCRERDGGGITSGSGARGQDKDAVQNESLAREVERIAALDLDDLRIVYRQRLRKPVPAHIPRWLLLRIVAYQIQAQALGDLDRETVRYLDRVRKDLADPDVARPENNQARRKKPVPGVPPPPGRLRAGTQLVREHGGALHKVIVLDAGFSWEGKVFSSLSEVARAITGTSWNGPAFFGLRPRNRLKGSDVAKTTSASGAGP